MTRNVGGVDRVLRILVGLAALAFALFSQSEFAAWGYLGLVPLATGLIGWCPAYLPFGLKTCRLRGA